MQKYLFPPFRYAFKSILPAFFANVGLALPGGLASWETETKGYQFWTRADKQGNFVINNVRPGTYNLYARVPGYHGDYRYKNSVIIKEGGVVRLNGLVFNLPRYGPSLWHIGYPDRSASEFYVPDVNPYYKNSLYLNFDKFRQYGLWERYSELYPKNDLTFTIGSSNIIEIGFSLMFRGRLKMGGLYQQRGISISISNL